MNAQALSDEHSGMNAPAYVNAQALSSHVFGSRQSSQQNNLTCEVIWGPTSLPQVGPSFRKDGLRSDKAFGVLKDSMFVIIRVNLSLLCATEF